MKHISIDYCHAHSASDQLTETLTRLKPEIKRIQKACSTQYQSVYASINLPSDRQLLDCVDQLVHQKKALQPSILVVIGIGGSNLGTVAIHNALNGILYNEQALLPKVYFLETVESDYTYTVLKLIKNALMRKETVLVNVVTKSGTTTETVANFLLVLELIKKYHPQEYAQYVVVTTNYQSKLWHIAQQEQFACLEIPDMVGGRYSVFSAVGLFPLGILGIDTHALVQGAHDMVHVAIGHELLTNPAAVSACIKYMYYQQGVRVNDFFAFSQGLEGVGVWYRQLMGESLGKTTLVQGSTVHVGLTPTVSVGTTDLHSVGQLYLGGPRDRLITFLSVDHAHHTCTVPTDPLYAQLVPHVQGQTFNTLMHAMLGGVLKAYEHEERPYLTLSLPQTNAYYIGQLMQMYMIEMMYLGFLLNVDPFDQPHVELYKEQTRKILAHE